MHEIGFGCEFGWLTGTVVVSMQELQHMRVAAYAGRWQASSTCVDQLPGDEPASLPMTMGFGLVVAIQVGAIEDAAGHGAVHDSRTGQDKTARPQAGWRAGSGMQYAAIYQ